MPGRLPSSNPTSLLPTLQIFPEQSCREATTALLVDPRTGQVLRHEDYWWVI